MKVYAEKINNVFNYFNTSEKGLNDSQVLKSSLLQFCKIVIQHLLRLGNTHCRLLTCQRCAWTGFLSTPMTAVIEMDGKTPYSSVTASALLDKGSHIMNPVSLMVMVSDDGENYTQIYAETYPVPMPRHSTNIRMESLCIKGLGECEV